MGDYIIEMQGICKNFPGVKALRNVDFKAKRGEVHALVGENGAGKSTLMKILAGVFKQDEGKVILDGQEILLQTPQQAINMGISTIYQELNLVPRLNVIENVMLGHEVASHGWLDKKTEYIKAKKWLDYVNQGTIPDYSVHAGSLSVANQQMVEIAKALSLQAKLIVMDEPTASLTEKEMIRLFEIVNNLKKDGVTVIYISHRLEEIFSICDMVTVLRDGMKVDTQEVSKVDRAWLIKRMIGREMSQNFPPHASFIQKETALEVKKISGQSFKDISFCLKKGEILGFFGLVGSGRTEVVRAIFGEDRIRSGEILLNGRKTAFKHPANAVDSGIGFATEDRKRQGLFLSLDVSNNISIADMKQLSTRGFIKKGKEAQKVKQYIKELQIAVADTRMLCKNLSGGNQQKVVLAKWLIKGCSILILDEPTRGIDVGAKYEIFSIINKLAENGTSIIIISSELPEILAMSDNIIVMHEGRIAGRLSRSEANETNVLMYATNLN
jgi:ABC-type sugar transport system ATPase subunit